MAAAAKEWMSPQPVSKKRAIWVRGCYEDMYSDILDLTSPERDMRYIHISGTPGIGKSCFLWYVLERLLADQVTPVVIVELVKRTDITTYVFRRTAAPAGDDDSRPATAVHVEEISSASESPEYEKPDTWLLTDQEFMGKMARRTVLFASPNADNWVAAEKTMYEGQFTTLYMPPWSVEELQAVSQRLPVVNFWKMYYVAGGVVRYYHKSLKEAYRRIRLALEKVTDHRFVDATLFQGGHDRGEFSHRVFVSWPTLDYESVDHISFISEWAAEAFAIACFNGKVRNWSTDFLSLSSDRSLRAAAGVLFERYAHHRLAMGGEFKCVDDHNQTKSLSLERRKVRFFGGNDLNLQVGGLYYLRPSSSSYPVIDSLYPPLILFQVSIAMKRKAIKRSDYEALCASLKAFRVEHPDVDTGLRGVGELDQVYAVLVRMEGDNTNNSARISVLEDVPGIAVLEDGRQAPEDEVPQVGRRSKRLRARAEASNSSVKDEPQKPTQVLKRSRLPFQMTIVLNVDEAHGRLYFPSLADIDKVVRSRLVGKVDTGAKEFGDNKREVAEDAVARVIMRQGRGSVQYGEKRYDVPGFGVWLNAVRSGINGGFKVETSLTVHCTAGKLAGRELTVFINERVGPDVMNSPPSVVHMPRPGCSVRQAFKEPAMEEEIMGDYELVAEDRLALGGEHEVAWSGDTDSASVVIRSNAISSRKIKLVFPRGDEADENSGDEADENSGDESEADDMVS